MDNYLIDREALEQYIDGLMKQKLLPANNAEELNTIREKAIKDLDDRIGATIFGNLSKEKLQEINKLLDDENLSPEIFQQFFKDANIDLQKIIGDTMVAFGQDFLGGQNE